MGYEQLKIAGYDIKIKIRNMECRFYTEQRNRLSDSLNSIPVVNLDLLVNENADFPGETNVIIKRAVLRYIKETQRFT